jgi:hypothetical protein
VPMAASVAAGQYTPASAVGAAMKRGRGRPIDFAAAASKPYQHHLHQHQPHQSHQPQQQFGFHFGSIGWYSCSHLLPHMICKYSRTNLIFYHILFFL